MKMKGGEKKEREEGERRKEKGERRKSARDHFIFSCFLD